jgi:excisionase family DNA binding protein
MLDLMTVPDAARTLGLNPSRVRAMAADGQLAASKVGDRWLFERSSVEARRRLGGHAGRPFESHNAWALLLLASGNDVEDLHPSVRSRLRRALRVDGLEKLVPRLRRRGESRYFDAHPGELRYLADDPAFLRTGISAAGDHGLDLVAGHEADGYVLASSLEHLVIDHALSAVDVGSGNVRVRVVPDEARSGLVGLRSAPIATVAIDLAEEADSRSADLGRRTLRDLASRYSL